ncbi:hypothetical protein [Kitasatospora sp. NBC_01266]|uniref:hypothetical protein n=1 Tax=Kitasatospora sp. NBC_01266 TaxID=2903572 RepID=UPI002E314597|nr:hypothetical protein [Kitasatospora sp. NBC_01266]
MAGNWAPPTDSDTTGDTGPALGAPVGSTAVGAAKGDPTSAPGGCGRTRGPPPSSDGCPAAVAPPEAAAGAPNATGEAKVRGADGAAAAASATSTPAVWNTMRFRIHPAT